jgi:hypothetical protein
MRAIFYGVFAAVVVASIGVAGLQAAGMRPNIQAAGAALLAGVAASIASGSLLILARRGTHLILAQASLASTVVHMLVLVGAAGLAVCGVFHPGAGFLPWLCIMYTVTLIALVVAIIRAIRIAPPPTKSTQ